MSVTRLENYIPVHYSVARSCEKTKIEHLFIKFRAESSNFIQHFSRETESLNIRFRFGYVDAQFTNFMKQSCMSKETLDTVWLKIPWFH